MRRTTPKSAGCAHSHLRSIYSTSAIPARHLNSSGWLASDRASVLKRAISALGSRKPLLRTITAKQQRSDMSSRGAKAGNWVKRFGAIGPVGFLGPLRNYGTVSCFRVGRRRKRTTCSMPFRAATRSNRYRSLRPRQQNLKRFFPRSMSGGVPKELISDPYIRREHIQAPSHRHSFEKRRIARLGSPCSLWLASNRSAALRTGNTGALSRLRTEMAGGQSWPDRDHQVTCNRGLNDLSAGVHQNYLINDTLYGDVRLLICMQSPDGWTNTGKSP